MPSLIKVILNAWTRSHMTCSCTPCIHLRDRGHARINQHYTLCIRWSEAQVWMCGCNQASFPSADSSFSCLKSASLEAANILQLPGHRVVCREFQALSEITTKTLSPANSTDTTSSLFFPSAWGSLPLRSYIAFFNGLAGLWCCIKRLSIIKTNPLLVKSRT